MESESKVDPKMIEEILKFTKNVVEAPKLVSAPDEINLEVTAHDVVQEIDKTRLLHYKPMTEKQHKTPLLISYALINKISHFRYSSGKKLGKGISSNKDLMFTC